MSKQKEHEEPYYPDYRGFSFGSKEAQYKYLRSKWPHHQHRILVYLYFKNIMGREPYVTIDEIASELKIHKARSCLDLRKMVSRRHMKSSRDFIPHRYYLTDQGLVYSEYIWTNFFKYDLDLFEYFHAISHAPEIPVEDCRTIEESIDYNHRWLIQMLQKDCAFQGMLFLINKGKERIEYYRSKSMLLEEADERAKVFDRICRLV